MMAQFPQRNTDQDRQNHHARKSRNHPWPEPEADPVPLVEVIQVIPFRVLPIVLILRKVLQFHSIRILCITGCFPYSIITSSRLFRIHLCIRKFFIVKIIFFRFPFPVSDTLFFHGMPSFRHL